MIKSSPDVLADLISYGVDFQKEEDGSFAADLCACLDELGLGEAAAGVKAAFDASQQEKLLRDSLQKTQQNLVNP